MQCEKFTVITRDLYGFALPDAMKPGYWLAPLAPTVHGFPMSSLQVRTDDYQRAASEYRIECTIRAASEAALMALAESYGQVVRQSLYLQRAAWGMLKLTEGSDIELKPAPGARSSEGILSVVMVAYDRKWYAPDGSVVLGER